MVDGSKLKGWCCWIIVILIAALVVTTTVVTIRRKAHKNKPSPVPGPPGSIQKKYSDVLGVAMQFLDVQKSDLSRGMYDAGDHMKPGFPMAFTVTVLSWEILEYGDQMDEVSQLEPAQGSLKWITDYLINAHPSPNVLYVQVDDPDVDHKCWQRPEDMTEERPVAKVDEKSPGSDVAGETSAALAAASLRIIQQELPKVQTYYNFTDFGDDLLWAATWLYHATSDKTYLDYVTAENGKSFARWGKPSWFSWDDKHAGTQENCGGCYVWSNT